MQIFIFTSALLLRTYTTIKGKIFETKFSKRQRFHVKQQITGKVQLLFSSNFIQVLTKFIFEEEY